MSKIRFGGANTRGPSANLWMGVADWVNKPLAFEDFAGVADDFHPFLGADVGISDDGTPAVATDPYGVVTWTESQGADEVVGFLVDCYVDLDRSTFKKAGMEARFHVVDDNDTSQTFVGFTDEALALFFGTDNTPDGSSFGLRWNGDETVDLVSIASDDTITVVIDAIATVERTVGFVKFGFTIELQGDGKYRCVANLGRTVSGTWTETTKSATTSTVPTVAMKPALIHTNDNEAGLDMDVDWYVAYNKSNV